MTWPDEGWDDDDARRADTQRVQRAMSEAPAAVRAWCQHFLEGAALGAQPSLDERAGYTLSKLAPDRVRTPATGE